MTDARGTERNAECTRESETSNKKEEEVDVVAVWARGLPALVCCFLVPGILVVGQPSGFRFFRLPASERRKKCPVATATEGAFSAPKPKRPKAKQTGSKASQAKPTFKCGRQCRPCLVHDLLHDRQSKQT